MSTEEKISSSDNQVSEQAPKTEVTKKFFRKKVWDYLEKNKLVNFPWPAFGRIPNFKGADAAAAKLLDLTEFKEAKTVEVNPDKPLEACRALVIDKDKILYVPVPKLREGLLKRISFCNEDKPHNTQQIVTRWGIETLGKAVDFEDKIHIDLIVLGSVAVSLEGRRIGKGKGYADLEFAILKEMKAVNDDTVIATIVHDSQVFPSLPKEMFKKHDVPVDYILTPTEIIKVEKKLPRPEGIYWDLLSEKDLNLMPVLRKVRDLHSSEGKDSTLKEVDVDEESKSRTRRRSQSRAKSESTENQKPRRGRYFKRSNSNQVANENEDSGKENEPKAKSGRPFRRSSKRLVDFSLVVSNIDPKVRVRHLKDALIGHGIKPNNITWRGCKGFCYLHYVKPVKKESTNEEEKKPFAVDNVIEILQTLKLNPEPSSNLSVKVMEPITRIETTDVTAV